MNSYLRSILCHYGYTTSLKQEAFAHLLALSGAMDLHHFNNIKDKVFLDAKQKSTAEASCRKFQDINSFDAEKFLGSFLQEGCFTMHNVHDWLVKVTQTLFFARSGERWESEIPDWIKGKEKEILSHISILESEKAILPTRVFYDAICIFGTTKRGIIHHYDFLIMLAKEKIIQESTIYLLTGERYASDIDGTEKELSAIALEYNVTRKNLTETHLMQYFYKKAIKDHPFMQKWKCIVVDTPKGNKTRPTTKDTLELFKRKTQNSLASALFISQAPYIYPQKEDVEAVLENVIPLRDVVGSSCHFDAHSHEDLLSYVSHILEALGSQLFGGYKCVFHAVCEDHGMQKNIHDYSDTYINNRMRDLSFSADKH